MGYQNVISTSRQSLDPNRISRMVANIHNWHDDCDHNFLHLEAIVSMALASALLPEWFVSHLTAKKQRVRGI